MTIWKKGLSLGLALALCAGLLSGCGGTPDGANSSEVSGVVNLDGSTSMEKVMGILGEAFMELNGKVTVNCSGTGSSAGITSAKDGSADIGLSSRALKPEEEAEGLMGTTVALDGIAILVHPSNNISDLSLEQIRALATGEVKNWKELGGTDGPVVLIGREAGSGTRDGFESILDAKDQCVYQNELTSTGDVIANVASNPNAIGYASFASVDDTVTALSVDGVTPSEEAVQDGSYAVQRDFVLVTRTDSPLSTAAQAFFEFALSEEAHAFIRAAGAVPLAA